MLSVNNISVGYKGVLAIQGVSFEVTKGEVVSLIGSNGAGKSTIIKTVAGLLHPKSGQIHFENQPIHHTPPYEIVKKRISMIPEGRRLFGRLSTLDNLRLGAYALDSKEEIEETLKNVFGLFPILNERKHQRSETLSGGGTAAARHCPWTYVQAVSPDARRAFPRVDAETGLRDLSYYSGD
jgi:branched-chain amino acid transport system ATP-binding protein